jgi:hypothetical protein
MPYIFLHIYVHQNRNMNTRNQRLQSKICIVQSANSAKGTDDSDRVRGNHPF